MEQILSESPIFTPTLLNFLSIHQRFSAALVCGGAFFSVEIYTVKDSLVHELMPKCVCKYTTIPAKSQEISELFFWNFSSHNRLCLQKGVLAPSPWRVRRWGGWRAFKMANPLAPFSSETTYSSLAVP